MQEKTPVQKLLGAFVVGGCIAVVAQIIMMIVGAVVPNPSLVAPISLVFLGLAGMVLVIAGVYKKIAEIGGFGAGIMFCGLVDAVAGVFVGASMEAGGNPAAGTKASLKFAVSILGSLVLVGTLLGVLCAHVPGVLATMGGATVPAPGPIVILYAFLMGGLISVEGQALLTFTPIPEPAVILGNAALGMLLTIFGVAANLEVLTGAGLCATVVDAGAGAVLGGAMIANAGVPMVTIVLVVVMALVVLMGIISGNILLNKAKQQR